LEAQDKKTIWRRKPTRCFEENSRSISEFLGEQKKERELKTQKKKAAEEKAVQRAKKD